MTKFDPFSRSSSSSSSTADWLLINGRCYTFDSTRPVVQALAIGGDRILAMGDTKSLLYHKGPHTKVLDLQQKVVIPGIIESHGHLIGTGQLQQLCNVTALKSELEVGEKLKEFVAKTPAGRWIKGRGWDQNLWNPPHLPDHQMLSSLAPNHPVTLTRVDGHASWVNRRALEMAGISANTPDPAGGKILRDQRGVPTGVLIDNAMDLVEDLIPSDLFNRESALAAGLQECLKHGITAFHDADSGRREIDTYLKFLREERLSVRLYPFLRGRDSDLLEEYFATGPQILGDHRLQIRALKLYSDGALGSCGAALLEPYFNDNSHCGLLLLSEEEIYTITAKALHHGLQVCTHAIGDQANRTVLNAYQRALSERPTSSDPRSYRLRIEHAQMVAPQDIPRFAQLGIIASIQATHCTSDMPWLENRIGKQRAAASASPWRSFLEAGVPIANGSDTPIESINPFWGIYASITRQDHHGHPPGGWNPQHSLTRAEALQSFTSGGAYASFSEHLQGQLRVGHLADLAVLDRDIMEIPEREILGTKVLLTMVGGRDEYRDSTHSIFS